MQCKNWEYTLHSNAKQVERRCTNFLAVLRAKPNRIASYGLDTRPAHKFMFRHTMPLKCRHFAGNYRGSTAEYLQNYDVRIKGGPQNVGFPAIMVGISISSLEKRTQAAIDKFQTVYSSSANPQATLLGFVQIIADLHCTFLQIHPYANGNGHMARLLVWVLLGRFKFWPKKWPLNSRPSYDHLLAEYLAGKKQPLEKFILMSIIG